jgi:hypothetical protein
MKAATILAIIGCVFSLVRFLAHGTGILRRYIAQRVEDGWTRADVDRFNEIFTLVTGTISECFLLVFFVAYYFSIKPRESAGQSRLHRS